MRAFHFFEGYQGWSMRSCLLTGADPEIRVLATDKEKLTRARAELPDAFREAAVLGEMEGMSYKEIADVTSVPPGTGTSRFADARTRLRQALSIELSRGY